MLLKRFSLEEVETGSKKRLLTERWLRLGPWIPLLAALCYLPFGVAAAPYVAEPFEDTVVLTGLQSPTAVRFAPDGQVFVAEQSGVILMYESLDDSKAEVFADLSKNVYGFGGRGLLGLALHPEFASHPYVYVLYTYDAPPGESAPVWNDSCPTPPGAEIDGCVVSGRLSRLRVEPGLTATEEVLLAGNWCQQFGSHSVGALAFGPDGALYLSAGDGANFNEVDYGQFGGSLPGTPTPKNPCGDPPVPPGGDQVPPDAEGGALRSQDLLSPSDPTSFNGAVLRVDPETGEALPDNPLFGGAVTDDDRIIAFGLRNPFRLAVDPKSGEVWIGDVGSLTWEEINRIADATDAVVENFGWPCFEGADAQPKYATAGLDLCEQLYATPDAVTPPYYGYRHGMPPDPERCGSNNASAVSGLAVYPGGSFPIAFDGALFFADFQRRCIWTLFADASGELDPTSVTTLIAEAASVDLTVGPEGNLFYVDFLAGTVHRVGLAADYIFADGFETGDVAAWSAVTPPSAM